jgi:hypothetical protein
MKLRSSIPRARPRQPRRTARQIRKQETRERILQAAAAIARREGLEAASIPRVMRAAGLTVGGFYGHFASKAALDVEVIRTVIGAMPGRGLSGLNHLGGLHWVERATTRYLSTAHRDNPDGCPLGDAVRVPTDRPGDVHRRVDMDRLVYVSHGCLLAWQRGRGRPRAGSPRRLLAR